MSSLTPYSFIQSPCSDSSVLSLPPDAPSPSPDEADDDDRTFDPRAPRSIYSLYPLEYLLYCEVCHQIRCPRCVTEEIVAFFCPSCLFEVPSSNIKSEGDRYGPLPISCYPHTTRRRRIVVFGVCVFLVFSLLFSVSNLFWFF